MATFHTGPLVEFLMMDLEERRKYVGQQIRETRSFYKVSQTELANEIGVAQSYLANVEAGRRSPSPAMVSSIVNYFQGESNADQDEDAQEEDRERAS